MHTRKLLPILLIIALAVGFGGGVFFQKSQTAAPVSDIPARADLSLFWDVWDILHRQYVDKDTLDPQALVYGAISGLVKSVGDPYTVFLPPKESKQLAEQIRGSFGGVGIEIGIQKGILTVIAPIKNSPASRAGLLAGDKIIKIDEKMTEGMTVEEAVSLIRGQRGTTVTLTISRDSLKDLKEYRLVRDTIKIPSVSWDMLDGNVAHLQVHVFNQNIDDEFKKAAAEISQSSATKIILDLRNNPGGLLDSAVNLAGYFLDSNKVVTIEKFGDGTENLFTTDANAKLKRYPLIILVNQGSASASEIVAGALRDHRNITIVGEKTFGKGSVQEVTELAKGSSLKITVAKWYTPNGISINENGIAPNIEMTMSEEDIQNNRDPQLDKALELIRSL